MLDTTSNSGLISSEQYTERQSNADNGSFNKILQVDILHQSCLPFCLISADATNCYDYDRINCAVMSLLFFIVRVKTGAIDAMLQSIQLIKFCLRTGWGKFTTFMGGNLVRILHGLCQGNGAALARWLVLSSVLVTIYKSLGFCSKTETPITLVGLDTMGVLYVNDTHLLIMNKCVWSP